MPRERLEALRAFGFEPTVVVETSPGNFQYTYVLDKPVEADGSEPTQVLAALRDFLKHNGWGDPGCFDATRYIRVPGGINGKASTGTRTRGNLPA